MITQEAISNQYKSIPSLNHRLPWQDVNDEGLVLLEDGHSLGVCFELSQLNSDAKSDEALEVLLENIQLVLTSSIPLLEKDPWVLQVFLWDEANFSVLKQKLHDYIPNARHDDALTKTHLNWMNSHFDFLTQPNGIFIDKQVTGQRYQGKHRKITACLYRRYSQQCTPTQAYQHLQPILARLTSQLTASGIHAKRLDGKAVYDWLLQWFNPNSAKHDSLGYPGNKHKPCDWQLAEQVFLQLPQSLKHCWQFDNSFAQMLTIEGLRRTPQIGHLTKEQRLGESINTVFDQLPSNSVFQLSITFEAQALVEQHLKKIESSIIGLDAKAAAFHQEMQAAHEAIEHGNFIFPVTMSVYLRAETEAELIKHRMQADTTLMSHGFKVVVVEHELIPNDSYLRQLPMNYNPSFDKRYGQRARLQFSRDMAKLLPIYGRSQGSPNPGFIFFNRGGEPFCFDPLNPKDKTKNSHMLILGETGTGKSNLLVYLLMQMLSIYNPRLFIIEAGGSFDLFADFLTSQGKTVNRVKIDPKHPISLNPFSEGLRLLEQLEQLHQPEQNQQKSQAASRIENELAGDEADEERDLLGEMVMSAQLMVTGGEAKEEARFMRADRMALIDAIILAAKTVKQQQREQMIASDVVDALEAMANQLDAGRDAMKITRLREMSDSMRIFCTDVLSSQFFNREGQPWPVADVTILDMGLFAHDGYETQRAIAYMGCNNKLLAIAEANQRSNRPIIFASDENHLFAKQPLLAAVQARLTKMGRKLALWVWILTQNMADFPDEARKMLSMLETWICLAMSLDEIKEIERFKPLTDEQRQLFLSARKSPKQYTEGVLLGTQYQGLFRNVPPRECLSLVMTEQSEKFERQQLMDEHQCSEVEAALKVAERMKQTTDSSCDV